LHSGDLYFTGLRPAGDAVWQVLQRRAGNNPR